MGTWGFSVGTVLIVLGVALVGCSSSSSGGSGSKGKGLGEACTQDSDCANDWCELSGPPGAEIQQCAALCGADDSVCTAIDPRATCVVTHGACYLTCSKDSDCPLGAGCSGNLCYQPAH
jgi:hypothetical protein